MGSDHLGTSLAAGDAGFEEPEFAFWHEYNSGAAPLQPCSSLRPVLGVVRMLVAPKFAAARVRALCSALPSTVHHGRRRSTYDLTS